MFKVQLSLINDRSQEANTIHRLVETLIQQECAFCEGYGHSAVKCATKKAMDRALRSLQLGGTWGRIKSRVLAESYARMRRDAINARRDARQAAEQELLRIGREDSSDNQLPTQNALPTVYGSERFRQREEDVEDFIIEHDEAGDQRRVTAGFQEEEEDPEELNMRKAPRYVSNPVIGTQVRPQQTQNQTNLPQTTQQQPQPNPSQQNFSSMNLAKNITQTPMAPRVVNQEVRIPAFQSVQQNIQSSAGTSQINDLGRQLHSTHIQQGPVPYISNTPAPYIPITPTRTTTYFLPEQKVISNRVVRTYVRNDGRPSQSRVKNTGTLSPRIRKANVITPSGNTTSVFRREKPAARIADDRAQSLSQKIINDVPVHGDLRSAAKFGSNQSRNE